MSLKEQPDEFKYVLTRNSISTELIFAPEGWESNSKASYKRDMNYFGVIRSWGLPLDFVLDGAAILRRAYYEDGIEAVVRIDVYELNHSTWEHELAFSGNIDFSQFKHINNVVSVTLMEAGITQNIKAFENVKYEYPLTGNDIVEIELPGVAFTESATSIFTQSPQQLTHKRFIPPIDLVLNEMLSEYATPQNVTFQDINDGGFSSSSNWFLKANRVMTVNITGKIKGAGVVLFGGAQGFDIQIMNSNNSIIATIYSSSGSNAIIEFDFSFNVNLNLANNDRLFIYCRYRNVSGDKGIVVSSGDLLVSYGSVSDPSKCKGIKSFDLFKRIAGRISPQYPVDSFLLKNRWQNLIFTSGEAIREIEGSSIKISLKDFYLTMDGIDDSGLGIENNILRLEESNYFARNIKIVDVGEVECEIDVASDFMFNSIKIGYNDGNTDETNGREEYNSTQYWALPITRIQKEKNWMSIARADQFGIENLRVNFVKKSTTDTSGDNDTFMVDCNQRGSSNTYDPILGSSYQLVEGLTSPKTAYNLRLTPKKNLLRHSGYLRSILDRMDSRVINFGSGDKNVSLKTTKDSVTVKENENILVESLPGKYFLPVVATITCKLPINARQLFDSNPFGYVEFKWKNVPLQGYIIECSIDLAKNNEQEFKLLLTPNNNLLNLI